MLAPERQAKIVEILAQKGTAQVEELASELGVSAMTIRRDLDKLQKDEQIERCHGGAVIRQEISYHDKQMSNKAEKERIAEKAASFVREGDAIFLDAGTTTYEIATRLMHYSEIMIVTTDLAIASLLEDSKAEVFLIGGTLQKETGSVLGYHATQMLRDFKFDIAFLGASSIDETFEVTTPTISKMSMKRTALGQSARSYLCVDTSKFEKRAIVRVNDLGDYTGVITEKEFTEEEQMILDEIGAEIINV